MLQIGNVAIITDAYCRLANFGGGNMGRDYSAERAHE